MSTTVAGRRVRIGKQDLELGGKQLGWLRDSNDLLGRPQALRARLVEDGYLLIRGLQPREKVAAARKLLLENLAANAQLDASRPIDEGVATTGGRGAFLGGQKSLTHTPAFLEVVDAPERMRFFDALFGKTSRTYDYKWLRAVPPGGFTGAHYDVVYMGRGAIHNLYTCWTPLGDIDFDLGGLAILQGSHDLPSFARVRETYGRMDVDRDNVDGWFSNDPVELVRRFGGHWRTAEFQMGDVLIFGMFTMHASLTNVTDRYRLSCDTRYQPADEQMDERWVGETPIGHYAWNRTPGRSMEEARRAWGV